MATCAQCGAKVVLPYQCKYCGSYFCPDHRLPESHSCSRLPKGGWPVKPSVKKPEPAIRKVRLRNGKIVDFDRRRIVNDIGKRIRNREMAEELTEEVVAVLEQKYAGRIPTTRDIRGVVHKVLSEGGKPPKIRESKYSHPPRRPFRLPRFRLPMFAKILLLIFLILAIEYFVVMPAFYPTIYLLAAIIAGYLDWKIFQKAARIGVHPEARLFGINILSGLIALAGAFLLGFWYAFMIFQPIMFPQFSLGNPWVASASIFIIVLGLGLLVVAAFLRFRFMRRAGIIVFQR